VEWGASIDGGPTRGGLSDGGAGNGSVDIVGAPEGGGPLGRGPAKDIIPRCKPVDEPTAVGGPDGGGPGVTSPGGQMRPGGVTEVVAPPVSDAGAST